jgi:2-polyprenyl-3-methyl-5-hydroxy-6-metoxy-1,4-benzoquinol methylase
MTSYTKWKSWDENQFGLTSKENALYYKKLFSRYLPEAKNVLEIACNSGLLLEMFQQRGIESYGVDPAKNIRELSEKRNLNVFVDYWDKRFSEELKLQVGTLDLILAFHVLPHVQDPNDFIESCINVLSETGTIFIQTSQCDMLLNNEFDVIYHEHSSYFTGKSIQELAHRHNLFVSSIIKTDIHRDGWKAKKKGKMRWEVTNYYYYYYYYYYWPILC